MVALTLEYSIFCSALESFTLTMPKADFVQIKQIDPEHCKLYATDLESALSITLLHPCIDIFEIVVPLSLLLKSLSLFDASVNITLDSDTLTLKKGRNKQVIRGITEDLSSFPTSEVNKTYDLVVQDYVLPAQKLAPFVSTDPTKQIYQCLHFAEGKIYATDGYKLVVYPHSDLNLQLNILGSAFKSILSVFKKLKIEEFIINEFDTYQSITAQRGDLELEYYFRYFNMPYPPVHTLIPEPGEAIEVSFKAFKEAIDLISLFKSDIVRLSCSDVLSLSVLDKVKGDSDHQLEILSGKSNVSMCFRLDFLKQMLTLFNTSHSCFIEFHPDRCLFSDEQNDYTLLIMAVKTDA